MEFPPNRPSHGAYLDFQPHTDEHDEKLLQDYIVEWNADREVRMEELGNIMWTAYLAFGRALHLQLEIRTLACTQISPIRERRMEWFDSAKSKKLLSCNKRAAIYVLR